MNSVKIKLDTVDKVKSFIARTISYDGKLYVSSDGYRVDGKSIMGLFSLDLSQELLLESDGDKPLTFADPFKV